MVRAFLVFITASLISILLFGCVVNADLSKTWKQDAFESFIKGDYTETLNITNQVLTSGETNFFAYYYKIAALNKLFRYDEGLEVCNQCLQINPADEEIWQCKGDILYNLGNREEALDAYDNGNGEEKFQYCGINEYEARQEAELEIQKKIEDKRKKLEEDAFSYLKEAYSYYTHEEYENAIEECNKALDIYPKYYIALLMKGLFLSILDNDNEAKDVLYQATEFSSNEATPWYLLGRIYEKECDRTKAVNMYYEAVVLEPDNTLILQRLYSLLNPPAYGFTISLAPCNSSHEKKYYQQQPPFIEPPIISDGTTSIKVVDSQIFY